ncbi:MAG: ACT domain-containing protein [Cyanobacteria bacterium J06627_8]
MAGESDLNQLLASMTPVLAEDEFVFCTVSPDQANPVGISPVGLFCEAEGTTLILKRRDADTCGLPYSYVAKMITLSVHSSLDAVGFIAAIATRLSQSGISVNPVAGYYHDHLFVPNDRAMDAMTILKELSHQTS